MLENLVPRTSTSGTPANGGVGSVACHQRLQLSHIVGDDLGKGGSASDEAGILLTGLDVGGYSKWSVTIIHCEPSGRTYRQE